MDDNLNLQEIPRRFPVFSQGYSPLQYLSNRPPTNKTIFKSIYRHATTSNKRRSVYHTEEAAVLMEGGTVGFVGPPNAFVYKYNDETGEKEDDWHTAEELGILSCDDDSLPVESLGKVVCAKYETDEQVVYFEDARKGEVKVVVSRDHLKVMPDMGRQFLVEVLHNMTSRHDALVTLPQTAVFILVFMLLVSGHLRVWDQHNSKMALTKWINGGCNAPECIQSFETNVDDLEDVFHWLENGGMSTILGDPRRSKYYPENVHYMLASRNILIGDLRMEHEKFDGTTTKAWLLHEPAGLAALSANPGQYVQAAVASLQDLRGNKSWLSRDIETLRMELVTFDEMTGSYAKSGFLVRFKENGAGMLNIFSRIASIVPFADWDLYLWDVVYFLLVARVFFREGRDAYSAWQLGLGELYDYFEFWNCVDWASIFLASAFFVLLVCAVVIMTGNTLHYILTSSYDDTPYQVKREVMSLPVSFLEELHDEIDKVIFCFKLLFIIAALNSVAIVSQFFKGFTANPRLNVITQTFRYAGVDFAHFGIVVTTIFLPFALIGHILFGNDVPEFSSLYSSLSTAFVFLMGDYECYVEATADFNLSSVFPSGLPVVVFSIWYFTFMSLLFLVMLNMLLGIIIEHYSQAKYDMDELGEVPTLWAQFNRYLAFTRSTKEFMRLEKILALLNNDADLAHPKFMVTPDTLEESFGGQTGMTTENAQWLFELLEDELRTRRAQAVRLLDISFDNPVKDVDNHVHALDQRITRTCKDTHEILEIVNGLGATARSKSMQAPLLANGRGRNALACEKVLSAGLVKALSTIRTFEETLQNIILTLTQVQRDQTRLNKRLEEFAEFQSAETPTIVRPVSRPLSPSPAPAQRANALNQIKFSDDIKNLTQIRGHESPMPHVAHVARSTGAVAKPPPSPRAASALSTNTFDIAKVSKQSEDISGLQVQGGTAPVRASSPRPVVGRPPSPRPAAARSAENLDQGAKRPPSPSPAPARRRPASDTLRPDQGLEDFGRGFALSTNAPSHTRESEDHAESQVEARTPLSAGSHRPFAKRTPSPHSTPALDTNTSDQDKLGKELDSFGEIPLQKNSTPLGAASQGSLDERSPSPSPTRTNSIDQIKLVKEFEDFSENQMPGTPLIGAGSPRPAAKRLPRPSPASALSTNAPKVLNRENHSEDFADVHVYKSPTPNGGSSLVDVAKQPLSLHLAPARSTNTDQVQFRNQLEGVANLQVQEGIALVGASSPRPVVKRPPSPRPAAARSAENLDQGAKRPPSPSPAPAQRRPASDTLRPDQGLEDFGRGFALSTNAPNQIKLSME